jgi:hypothetical protein
MGDVTHLKGKDCDLKILKNSMILPQQESASEFPIDAMGRVPQVPAAANSLETFNCTRVWMFHNSEAVGERQGENLEACQCHRLQTQSLDVFFR